MSSPSVSLPCRGENGQVIRMDSGPFPHYCKSLSMSSLCLCPSLLPPFQSLDGTSVFSLVTQAEDQGQGGLLSLKGSLSLYVPR